MSGPFLRTSGSKSGPEMELNNPNHGMDLVSALTDLHVSGKFADVKMVCLDGALWSHRPLLAAVSPVLRQLLLDSVNDDVVTLIMPHLRRVHLKLVLDYVYSGSMTLRARQMAQVIGIIEVLHLKCGVSVSKRKDSECDWVEEAEFKDVSDKAFNDLCHFSFVKSEATQLKPEKDFAVSPPTQGQGSRPPHWVPEPIVPMQTYEMDRKDFGVPKLNLEDFEEGEPVEVRPVQSETSILSRSTPKPIAKMASITESVIEIEPDSESDDADSGHLSETGQASKTDDSMSPGGVKCIMCGKKFQHQANLRVHIQSHLGARAQLKSCEPCDRNFRSTMEHELHLSSHKYAKLIGKTINPTMDLKRRVRNRTSARLLRKSIRIMTSKSRRGNLYRKYIKKMLRLQKEMKRKREKQLREKEQKTSFLKDFLEQRKKSTVKLKIKVDPNKFKQSIPMSPMSAPPSTSRGGGSLLAPFIQDTPPPSADLIHCPDCPKSFGSRSSYLRHSKKQHTIKFTQSKKRKASPTAKKPEAKRPKLKISLSKSAAHLNSRSPASSSMSSPGYASPSHSVRRSIEQDLTCPTCDKVFLAKSIFERHIKTYKHGRYQIYEEASRTPSYIPQGGTNHMNLVLQPTIEVGGKEVNKYECHLCNQVFLRVKDLAKHRQRMCTAWKRYGSH